MVNDPEAAGLRKSNWVLQFGLNWRAIPQPAEKAIKIN
jgi:hypothetical protein